MDGFENWRYKTQDGTLDRSYAKDVKKLKQMALQEDSNFDVNDPQALIKFVNENQTLDGISSLMDGFKFWRYKTQDGTRYKSYANVIRSLKIKAALWDFQQQQSRESKTKAPVTVKDLDNDVFLNYLDDHKDSFDVDTLRAIACWKRVTHGGTFFAGRYAEILKSIHIKADGANTTFDEYIDDSSNLNQEEQRAIANWKRAQRSNRINLALVAGKDGERLVGTGCDKDELSAVVNLVTDRGLQVIRQLVEQGRPFNINIGNITRMIVEGQGYGNPIQADKSDQRHMYTVGGKNIGLW
jgi:hypothetical protein